MERYPVDLDPGQVVRWIKAECEASPLTFRTSARCTRELRTLNGNDGVALDDEDREDLSEVATVITLDVAPFHARDGWTLSITVEDELGHHSLGAGTLGEEVQIDPDYFYRMFIRRGRGNAVVSAEIDDPSARHRLNWLLHMIETDHHSPDGHAKPKRKRGAG